MFHWNHAWLHEFKRLGLPEFWGILKFWSFGVWEFWSRLAGWVVGWQAGWLSAWRAVWHLPDSWLGGGAFFIFSYFSISFCTHFPHQTIDFAWEVIEKRSLEGGLRTHMHQRKIVDSHSKTNGFSNSWRVSYPHSNAAFFNYLLCKINGVAWKMFAKTNGKIRNIYKIWKTPPPLPPWPESLRKSFPE